MNFSDIFKKSFLEGYASSDIVITSILSCLLIAGLLGTYIFVIYRILCRKAFYSKNFSISLIAIAVITASIILAVQSNVVISLGMVGALSIVRFRTAIKDPLDLVFLFWAISIGIICGAGLAVIAVVVSLVLSVLLWIFQALPVAKAPVLLLVSSHDCSAETIIMHTVLEHCKTAIVKSRNLSTEQLDLIVEIRTSDESALAAAVMALPNVFSSSIVAHDGEVTF